MEVKLGQLAEHNGSASAVKEFGRDELPLVREGQSVTLGIETKADERELVPTDWRDLAARFDFN
jgi:hypothetical protein